MFESTISAIVDAYNDFMDSYDEACASVFGSKRSVWSSPMDEFIHDEDVWCEEPEFAF